MDQKNEAYFSVDSRLLFQLGEKLVTDRAVALAELVKNSYDADATSVMVRMKNIRTKGGVIIVEDNGTGMGLGSFIQTWMRIATIDKEQNPVSSKYGRQKAGEKGIGRFACRRLSEILELESVAEIERGRKELLRATFTWAHFEPGTDVNATPVVYAVEPVSPQRTTGTVLTLQATTEPWDAVDIKRLRIQLIDLISPVTFDEELDTRPETHDPGFRVEFECPEFEMQVEPLDKVFFKNAWAKLSASVDSKGFATYDIDIAKGLRGKITKSFRRNEAFKHLRNVKMEAHFFSYRTDFFQEFRVEFISSAKGWRRTGRNKSICRHIQGLWLWAKGG